MTEPALKILPAIVGTPERGDAAHQLFKQLRIWRSMDFCPYVSIDFDGVGCDDNHLRAWRYLDRNAEYAKADWLMVLEDDVVLAEDFGNQVEDALTVAPAPIVSFYLGRTRPAFYQERIAHALVGCSHPGPGDPVNLDVPWLISNRLLSQQAVAIRRDVLHGMIKLLPEFVHRERAIDQGMTAYMRSASLPVAYTVPSLVDHLDGPSYAQHADRNPVHGPRVAWATGKRAEWSSEFRIM
jgi:GR25 family glycosyltransferase involved in LPS biosynthesis